MTNILQAIYYLATNQIPDIVDFYRSNNKINRVGDTLELLIKDMFANTLHEQNEQKKAKIYEQTFSYFGNANNPPDLMLIDGDAIEVKKLESEVAQIALNSSYPTYKLFKDNPMITQACRECETWSERDLLYAIGCIPKNKQAYKKQLTLLWLVYGDCYAASQEIYLNLKKKIIKGIAATTGVEFSPTKEIGRVNRVDPLGITHLRIRGMWQIEHPQKVYSYLDLESKYPNTTFRLFALMREDKYLSFSKESRNQLESIDLPNLKIDRVQIKSPDNPVKLINAKLITYQVTKQTSE